MSPLKNSRAVQVDGAPLDLLDQIDAAAIPAAIIRLSARLAAAPAPLPSRDGNEPDDLLTAQQAAVLLSVSTKYVYSHVRELGGVRIGKGPKARLRFSRSKVLKRIAA